MDVTKVPNKIWADIISGKASCDFEFLGLKFLIVRLRMKVKANPAESIILSCADELRDYFKQTGNLPVVQKDFEKVLKLGGIA